jgi:hypothetical protein
MTPSTSNIPTEAMAIIGESVKIVLGAGAAIMGAYFQSKLADKKSKANLKTEKFERIYYLCQAVYDGHRKEIINARKYFIKKPEKYLENRNHPGSEMSELKMLISSYAPDLEFLIEIIDKGHRPLKEAFVEFDRVALAKPPILQTELDNRLVTCTERLVDVGNGANEIKSNIAKQLKALVT